MKTPTFKIKMICHDPNGSSYEDEVKTTFDNLESAKRALAKRVYDELSTLKSDCELDRDFEPDFESEEHAVVVECLLAAPGDYDEDSYDTLPVTEYDIVDQDGNKMPVDNGSVLLADCVRCENLVDYDFAKEQMDNKGAWECPYCGARYGDLDEVGVYGDSLEDYYLNICMGEVEGEMQ